MVISSDMRTTVSYFTDLQNVNSGQGVGEANVSFNAREVQNFSLRLKLVRAAKLRHVGSNFTEQRIKGPMLRIPNGMKDRAPTNNNRKFIYMVHLVCNELHRFALWHFYSLVVYIYQMVGKTSGWNTSSISLRLTTQ
jgi:hypothetical protein